MYIKSLRYIHKNLNLSFIKMNLRCLSAIITSDVAISLLRKKHMTLASTFPFGVYKTNCNILQKLNNLCIVKQKKCNFNSKYRKEKEKHHDFFFFISPIYNYL